MRSTAGERTPRRHRSGRRVGLDGCQSRPRGIPALQLTLERLFDAETARLEGRNALADFLDAARSSGLEAGAWYPTKAGAEGLADAARRFGGAIVVLPSDAAKPGLAERLRGMALDSLRSTVVIPVVVANPA